MTVPIRIHKELDALCLLGILTSPLFTLYVKEDMATVTLISTIGAGPIFLLWIGRFVIKSRSLAVLHAVFSACLIFGGIAMYVNSFVVAKSQYAPYGFILVPVIQGILAFPWLVVVAILGSTKRDTNG